MPKSLLSRSGKGLELEFRIEKLMGSPLPRQTEPPKEYKQAPQPVLGDACYLVLVIQKRALISEWHKKDLNFVYIIYITL